ncbi:PAS domain S-box protein [Bradyrhizobium elkanii]|uniref:PAS domain-containing protein n=1 Tax=Bradyrhizobium elkanii TaxID=29448 RepID=UPI002711F1F9|nr:PAS domain S-box protein [Bradyrhizobium elkanii]WLA38394.1 PAS domain S-box protein [Bradyrhizobium elkanii]
MIEADDLASAPDEISAAQWRQIVNGATDTAIISADERGLVTSWNTGASRILGWSEPEMLGKSLDRIFAADAGQAQLRKEMEDATAHGRGGGQEGWRLRKDGSRFWAVGELSPIREGGKIVGFVKILRDCGFRFNPAGYSDLKPAIVPI